MLRVLLLASFLLPSSIYAQTSAREIHVSLEDRMLWLTEGSDTLFTAPIAIGKGSVLEWRGKRWVFKTPPGVRTVRSKQANPVWVPPYWHYVELAREQGLEPVRMQPEWRVGLRDGTALEMRDGWIGRVNQLGNFYAFSPGVEIIFDDKVFIPPVGSPQRRIPDVLGPYKLDLGDGYLIHGTNEPGSIGDAASHGCIRMRNEDVSVLYGMVDIGTKVYIR